MDDNSISNKKVYDISNRLESDSQSSEFKIPKISVPNFNVSKFKVPIADLTELFQQNLNIPQNFVSPIADVALESMASTIADMQNTIMSSFKCALSSYSESLSSSLKRLAPLQTIPISSVSTNLIQNSLNELIEISKQMAVNIPDISKIIENSDLYANNDFDINKLNQDNSASFDIHKWIATISTVIGLLMSIYNFVDSQSTKALEEQKQKQIIEYQSQQLKELEKLDKAINDLVQSKNE